MLKIKITVIMIVTILTVNITPVFSDQIACPKGEPIQWIADYCMQKIETDDEIAAYPCIKKELRKIKNINSCKSKLHYKELICKADIKNKVIDIDLTTCLKDNDFMGSTVRNNGVGG